ncbi:MULTISPECIES: S1C family serine protease [Haloferax]|uniref:PDZ domain-containing protein n=1 Tax=Haloferax marinum TaxID=2666143 RepID=A0A6A8G527_9EURY|nr:MULTISPECIES: trypsin-like peptidase domain-containing protein [Haloferax]KAB1196836.1 PDZ domain-containing protein [Haloferax sp. CBA1150]MRW95847.1 PDZ domain-containing protein [Haloferax marinum]
MSIHSDFEGLYRDVIPSVVSVYVGGRRRIGGAGSAFVYDDQHLVTNEHVSRLADETKSNRVELRFADGSWRVGEVVGSDVYTDLAVVAVDDLPADAAALRLATENPSPGRPVAALGNPLGLEGSISAGIVSGANRSLPTSNGFAIPDVVQTDAPINPGNSGGPLVGFSVGGDGDPTYEVVGVNRAKQGDNIGFAVSPLIANRILPDLVTDGYYRHSYLRARTLDVTPSVAEANGLDTPRGVLVVGSAAGESGAEILRGCAEKTRLRGWEIPVGGDVIVAIEGNEVRAHEELMRYLITETRPGEPVAIDVLRDGDPMTLVVELDERPTVDKDGRDGGSQIPIE